ncbi:MAG: ATP12 family protein [Xanthobacteraceae bacterium]
MRDIFEDIFTQTPLDGMEAARRAMRPVQRRRFYDTATVRKGAAGFDILLDGKPVRTPGRHTLMAPTQALADAIAAEWTGQKDVIDPATMPLTRLANAILDGVADRGQAVAGHIAEYLGSDLVFYRAEGPQGLLERQSRHWDPVVDWARDKLGAHFMVARGIMFVEQPKEALIAARAAIPAEPWRLGALASIATLTGSALLALMLGSGQLSVEEAWAAAHVDEDWNMEFWGRDERALMRRAFRLAEMQAAADVLRFAPAD